MRIGIAIDPATNDVFKASDKNLATVTEAAAVGQHVRQRLKTFFGEWFLDTGVGVKWIQQIFARKYNPALAESVVKGEILATDGVTSIETFAIRFDRTTRGILIGDVEVITDYDKRVEV